MEPVGDDSNGVRDVFLHAIDAATTLRASVTSGRSQASATSTGASIPGDGRFVVVFPSSDLLTASDVNGMEDSYAATPSGS